MIRGGRCAYSLTRSVPLSLLHFSMSRQREVVDHSPSEKPDTRQKDVRFIWQRVQVLSREDLLFLPFQ